MIGLFNDELVYQIILIRNRLKNQGPPFMGYELFQPSTEFEPSALIYELFFLLPSNFPLSIFSPPSQLLNFSASFFPTSAFRIPTSNHSHFPLQNSHFRIPTSHF
jgi:hypothetical protein